MQLSRRGTPAVSRAPSSVSAPTRPRSTHLVARVAQQAEHAAVDAAAPLQDVPHVVRSQQPLQQPDAATAQRQPLFANGNGSSNGSSNGGGASWQHPLHPLREVTAALDNLASDSSNGSRYNSSSSSSNGSGPSSGGTHADAAAAHHEEAQQQEVPPHMQQLLQQQHQLHQQQQQLQPHHHQLQQHLQPHHHQLQQQQQQQLQQQQLLNQKALRTAQYFRDQTNRRLTGRIRDVSELSELRTIMRQYEGALNHIHASALLCRLAKLVGSRQLRPRDMLALPSVLPQVLSLVEGALPDFDERCISNCLHSLAVLELSGERGLIAGLLAAAERVRLARFTPQGLAVTTWALGSLRVTPGPGLTTQLLAAAAAELPRFNGQELAQLGWGAAVLRLRVDEPWLAAWHGAVAAMCRRRSALTPQGMAMVLWATARLTDKPQQQQQAGAPHLQLQVPPQQQPGAAAAAGASGQVPAWLCVVEAALQQQLPSHTPRSLSMCLWALGKLGHRPSSSLLDAALQTLCPQLPGASSPTDLAVLLYSLAAMRYAPPADFMAAHAAGLRRRLKGLSVREASNVLWAHAQLGTLPADAELLPGLMELLRFNMQDACARDLSNTLWALAVLGVTPRHAFMATFGAQAEAVVHDFKPQEVSNLLWGYAKLGLKPPHMLLVALWEGVGIDAIHTASGGASSASSSGGVGGYADSGSGGGFYADSSSSSSSSSASARLSAFKPAELSMLVWAMAVLKLAPGKAWWDQFLQSSFHKMTAQTPQSLANIIWALSELQLQPPPAWLYHWAAATRAALARMNPMDLGQVASALQGSTFGRMGLPKLEALLSDVLARLAVLEGDAAGPAFSRAALGLLLKMKQQQQMGSNGASSSSGSGGNGGCSSSGGGSGVDADTVPQLKLAMASSSLDD